MPIKVFGSPFIATYVKNNAANFGITETIDSELFVYARGGEITAGGYGKDWISTALPTSKRTWAGGFYPVTKIGAATSSAATPDCIQDNNRFSGASGQLQGQPKELEFGFPGLAGTSDFIPLQATINYVRYWVLARGWQTRQIPYTDDGTGYKGGALIGAGLGACPSAGGACCSADDCWITPREILQGIRGGVGVTGVLYPHIAPVGNANLPATAESTRIQALQKTETPTYFRARDERTNSLKEGFVVRWDLLDADFRYSENWKEGNLGIPGGVPPNGQLADGRYYPNENYVMRSEVFRQNPLGNSGIPWTADYAQWCAFGLTLSTGVTCNCLGVMVSDFAIEIGYTEKAFVVNSRCGEAQPTTDGALLKGYFETSGLPADWRFEYGANPSSLSSATPWTLFQYGPQSIDYLLTGLAAGTWYYRLVLRDANLVLTYGDICSFETSANCQVRSMLVM